MRRAARIDSTQDEIVKALRSVGVSVVIIGKPVDLLLCCRGETSLMDCKSAKNVHRMKGEGLTKAQVEFIAKWPGKIYFARTAEEAVRLVLGVQAMA